MEGQVITTTLIKEEILRINALSEMPIRGNHSSPAWLDVSQKRTPTSLAVGGVS